MRKEQTWHHEGGNHIIEAPGKEHFVVAYPVVYDNHDAQLVLNYTLRPNPQDKHTGEITDTIAYVTFESQNIPLPYENPQHNKYTLRRMSSDDPEKEATYMLDISEA